MAETLERVDYFAEAAAAAIVADRQVPLRSDRDERGRIYASVAGELRPLIGQVAEMAEQEPHQLVAAAEYLHGLLAREPLRTNPAWEPQRVVLGIFLMGLTSALATVDVITAEERAALLPAYQRDARDAVTSAFDTTYIPPIDEEEDPMQPVMPRSPETDATATLALF